MTRKKVVFILDRVMHYQCDLFRRLDAELAERCVDLTLLSGMSHDGKGRVGLAQKIIEREEKFTYRELRVYGHTFRTQSGVLQQVQQMRPDVVVCASHVGNWTYWKLLKAKAKAGFRLVSWQCGYEYNPGVIKNLLLSRFVGGFDHHLAYHTNAMRYAIQHGAKPEQVTVVRNTINEKAVSPIPKTDARDLICAAHPIGNRKILLYVGAILREKRLEDVIVALDHLRRPDVLFLVVGDGPHLGELRKLTAKREDVLFAGEVIAGVGSYFDAADVFVLPGTGGLAINEAMVHGLPVIAGYADGSADDLVLDGVTGFRLREGTPAEIAALIGQLMDDGEMRRNMGDAARRMLTSEYSFEAFVQRVGDTLARI